MANPGQEAWTAGQEKSDAALSPNFVRPQEAEFVACRSESIDYAVMEHFKEVAVAPFGGQWSDVGSWNAVADLTRADDQGNRVEGQGYLLESKNTFVHAPHRTVVALGTDNLIIVDTPDALLVAHRDHAEGVKGVVGLLESAMLPQAATHRKVSRPWGSYDSVDAGERFQVKRIGVKPGASLSLQKHHHRAEHWIVVSGTAEVTRGSEVFLLSENQSTYIPIGEVHRLRNPGKVDLEMIEVQSGSYLGEDDIVRLEDNYGRAP
jgi:mannose-1-phosphate guanylyltransferase/mannose-6-phosphate isomerase